MQWSPDSAIYKQLADIISDYILQGVYKDGDSLPSVRQISSEYEINHITVSKAYQTLVDLGEKREHAFKDYLIEHGNIKSSRILVCKPQIDSDEGAIPRIEISV